MLTRPLAREVSQATFCSDIGNYELFPISCSVVIKTIACIGCKPASQFENKKQLFNKGIEI